MTPIVLLGWALAADPFSLEWTAPQGCPTGDAVTERIATAIGDAEGPPLQARAAITEQPDGSFQLSLTLGREGEPEGTRTLEGPTCAAVSDAAILIVAIAIDPNAAESLAPDPEPQPAPDPAPIPEPDPPPDPEPAPAPDPDVPAPAPVPDPDPTPTPDPTPPRPLHLDTTLTGGVAFGTLPSVGAALGLHVALHGARWRVELGGTYETPRETEAPSNPDVRGRFQLWSVDARGCPVLGSGALTFPLCVGIRAGLMHGVGRGAVEPTAAASPWVAASVAPTVLWRPPSVAGGRLLIGARAEGSVSLTRPGFATAQANQIFEAGPLGGQIGALLGFALR